MTLLIRVRPGLLRMLPRCAVGAREEFIRFIIAHDSLRHRIPRKGSPKFGRDVRQYAARSRDVTLFDVSHWATTRSDRGKQILKMMSHCRSYVTLEICFGAIFRILIQLVSDVSMN